MIIRLSRVIKVSKVLGLLVVKRDSSRVIRVSRVSRVSWV